MKSFITLVGILLCGSLLAQNTGIGTTTPQTRLHVVDSAGDATIRVETVPNSNVAQLQAKTSGGIFDVLQLQKWSPGSSGTVAGIALDNLSTVLAGVGAGALAVGTQTASHLYFLTNNLERMRITNTGNVGIGTMSPTQKLQVAGIIKADSLNFTAAKTEYYSLSGGDFNAKITSEIARKEEAAAAVLLESGTNGLIAPIHLPQGATITRVTVYFYDNSGVDLNFRLRQNGGISAMASLSTSGTPGYNSATTTTIFNGTIDNSRYAYVFEAIPTASWPGYNIYVQKVIIQYQVSGL